MAIRTLLERITPITKQLADEFALMEASTGECAFDARHAEALAVKMETGVIHAPIWASVFCLEDNKIRRSNGKHTSTNFHVGRLPCQGYKVHEIRYECDRIEEVSECYNQFDQPESGRSPQEINQSIASTIPELAPMSPAFIDRCVSGIDLGLGSPDKGVSKLHKATRLRNEVPFVLFAYSLNDPWTMILKKIKHIQTVPVMAAMHKNFHEHPQMADAFWRYVRDGSNNSGPDRDLYVYLLTAKVPSGNAVKKAATKAQIMAECQKQWQKFLKKSKVNVDEAGRPNFKLRGRRRKSVA